MAATKTPTAHTPISILCSICSFSTGSIINIEVIYFPRAFPVFILFFSLLSFPTLIHTLGSVTLAIVCRTHIYLWVTPWRHLSGWRVTVTVQIDNERLICVRNRPRTRKKTREAKRKDANWGNKMQRLRAAWVVGHAAMCPPTRVQKQEYLWSAWRFPSSLFVYLELAPWKK